MRTRTLASCRAMLESVAILCDIHGNAPALEAVLAEVRGAAPDLVVIGGDVAAGPMPAEVLDALARLDLPIRWVRGNADREVLAPPGGGDALARADAWVHDRLAERHLALLAQFEPTVEIEVQGLGRVLCCHGTPRSDEEIVTRITPDARLREILAGVEADVVVGGHTHQQLDRKIGSDPDLARKIVSDPDLAVRFVNAGSVGMPYEGDAGAFWALLGPDVDLRRTSYDVAAAAQAMRATGFPDVDELILRESLLEPIDPQEVAELFEARATSSAEP